MILTQRRSKKTCPNNRCVLCANHGGISVRMSLLVSKPYYVHATVLYRGQIHLCDWGDFR